MTATGAAGPVRNGPPPVSAADVDLPPSSWWDPLHGRSRNSRSAISIAFIVSCEMNP
jgi:hypothetical protein